MTAEPVAAKVDPDDLAWARRLNDEHARPFTDRERARLRELLAGDAPGPALARRRQRRRRTTEATA